MPAALKNWLGLSLVALCALAVVAIAAASVCFFGFAWAVIIVAIVGALIYRFVPAGPYGEGSYVILTAWILLAIGLAAGLVLRLALHLVLQ